MTTDDRFPFMVDFRRPDPGLELARALLGWIDDPNEDAPLDRAELLARRMVMEADQAALQREIDRLKEANRGGRTPSAPKTPAAPRKATGIPLRGGAPAPVSTAKIMTPCPRCKVPQTPASMETHLAECSGAPDDTEHQVPCPYGCGGMMRSSLLEAHKRGRPKRPEAEAFAPLSPAVHETAADRARAQAGDRIPSVDPKKAA